MDQENPQQNIPYESISSSMPTFESFTSQQIVEALVYTQDWIRTTSRNITMDTLEDLMKDDELAKEIQEGLDKQKEEQTQGKEKNVQA
ncbi:hypothetical protein Tco_0958558 [Tanacetum coccineum]